ncbi:MAG TPA: SDR family oxidoreductase [Candidatus Acidoferrales bacterium]|nr:SDR family oxidoreductase [Candidatus Acidoferrales bacterium]
MSAQGPLATFAPGLFRGRTALVTGGGRGIGRAVALGFARLGANLIIASRNPENLEPTAKEIEALGVGCLAVPTNIRETDQVDALLAKSIEHFGAVDFLVNNAGGQFPARPHEISDRGWRAVVDLNLNGTWNMCSRFGAHMLKRGFGSVVNIVHIYSFERGSPAFAHSGAARAGVVNLTRSLAYYWARHGVTINALAPGTVSTRGVREEEFRHAEQSDYETIAVRDIPAHRLAEADEVAAITLFLCSPAARYINGASLIADGALSLDSWTAMFDPEVIE